MSIDQWRVRNYLGLERTFESFIPAAVTVFAEAYTDRPTMYVAPDGEEYLVMRVSRKVRIQAVKDLTGGGGE